MSKDTHDFDAVAADDALIEAIIAGSVEHGGELTDALVALHAFVSPDDAEPGNVAATAAGRTPAEASRSSRFATTGRPSRTLAVVCATGVILAGGVSAAVAGDPAAPLRYIVRAGVLIGENLSSPDSSGRHRLNAGVEWSTPARQGVDRDAVEPRSYSENDQRTDKPHSAKPRPSHAGKGDEQDADAPKPAVPTSTTSPPAATVAKDGTSPQKPTDSAGPPPGAGAGGTPTTNSAPASGTTGSSPTGSSPTGSRPTDSSGSSPDTTQGGPRYLPAASPVVTTAPEPSATDGADPAAQDSGSDEPASAPGDAPTHESTSPSPGS